MDRRDNRRGSAPRQDDRGYRGRDNRGGQPPYNRRYSGGNDRQPPPEKTPLEKVKDLLVRIGDNLASPLERNLAGLAEALSKMLAQDLGQIIDILLECALNLPTKTPVYGTLIGLMYTKSPDFGKAISHRIYSIFAIALKRVNFYDIKFLTRLLSELVNANVVDAKSLFALFDRLLSDDASAPQGRRDFFAMVVMQSLPSAAHRLNQEDPEKLKQLMETLDNRTANRDPLITSAISVLEHTNPVSLVRWVYEALAEQAQVGWPPLSTIRSPWVHFKEQLDTSSPLTLFNFSPNPEDIGLELPDKDPSPEERVIVYPTFQNLFHVLDKESQLWSSRSISNVDRFVIQDYIIDLMHFFNEEYKEKEQIEKKKEKNKKRWLTFYRISVVELSIY
eukprot:TRINITY_DN3931_c0_g1_i1.p2 TRINITY_DN3931_c0_g1~~TRINITY_DN3931_c0_g1_i1.p2  ORF type:complete len:391 (-),score=86.45 TRINITY_DN3931_c0_g1_i1:1397-2569(-)